MGKIDHFSDEAKNLMSLAQKCAKELKHPEIHPEHLLIAMTQSNTKVQEILDDEDIISEKLLPYIKKRFVEAENQQLDLNEYTKQPLQQSLSIVIERRDNCIQSYHLLLALISQPGILNILNHFRVDKNKIVISCDYYLSEFPETAILMLPYKSNFLELIQQSLQSFFRKKKNDE